MSHTPDLPESVITNILCRLPVRSLSRFKCVSKPWRNLISEPYFIKLHLISQNNNIHKLIFKSSSYSLLSLDVDEDHSVSTTNLVSVTTNFKQIVGSCDGLVLLVEHSKEKSLFLLNPSTGCYKKLPKPSLSLGYEPPYVMMRYGVGYDSSNDDYKVVRITMCKDLEYHDLGPLYVSVYSVKSGTWRDCTNRDDPSLMDVERSPGVFHNGLLHWRAVSDGSCVMAVFDLQAEKLYNVPLPALICSSCFFAYKLASFGGKFYIFNSGPVRDVWVMNGCGESRYWTKFDILSIPPNMCSLKSLFFLSDGCFLVMFCGKMDQKCMMSLYNKEGRIVRDMVGVLGDWIPEWSVPILSYVESLVSPYSITMI